jgi:FtsH-binding integral membrane protein
MNRKYARLLGIFLIVLTWIIWIVILILPFFKLTLTQYAITYPILLAATNIFWVGAALVGKELIQKFNLLSKMKDLLNRLFKRKGKNENQ